MKAGPAQPGPALPMGENAVRGPASPPPQQAAARAGVGVTYRTWTL
jgi:hypothetical protein